MSKIFILDTNVLLHDPKSLTSFQENDVVIPLVVLDELDKKKSGVDEVARHARMVIRALDEMRVLGNIHEGIKTAAGGVIKVELDYTDKCPVGLDPSRIDNRLIGVALGIKGLYTNRQVILVTKDINLRVKGNALGIDVEDYNADSVADDAGSIYSGTGELTTDDDALIERIYTDGSIPADSFGTFFPNQYLQLKSSVTPKKSVLTRYEDGSLVKIKTFKDIWGINSRNKEQAYALDALFNPNIKLVTMMGTSGTGKTLLAAAASISQVFDTHEYRKLIMSRPVQSMGKDIGFLPGSLEEKMAPWMGPLRDNLDLLCSNKGSDFFDMQQEAGIIEVGALSYIRGRSIPKSILIIDESQNISLHEAKTIITRIGEGSKIILNGDIFQIDTQYLDSVDNGLSCVVEKFKKYPIAAHITLKKGERSELATLASEIL